MPKVANPTPPIVSLVAIHELFRRYKNLPDPDKELESAYNKSLSKALADEKIIDEKGNESFTATFRSKPLDADWQRAGGMDTKRLDRASKLVIEHFDLLVKLNLADTMPHDWDTFSRVIFPTPSFLEKVNERKYFKYLDDQEKKTVEDYVYRRYNELDVIKDTEVSNYCVYSWSFDYRTVRRSILTITPAKKSATYYYFPVGAKKADPEGVLVSEGYAHADKVLSLDMVEETKSYIRAHFMFGVSETQLSDLKVIKGAYVGTMSSSNFPYCGEVALCWCASYLDAWEMVVNGGERKSLLSLEVLNRKLDGLEVIPIDESRLRSFPLHTTLKGIIGFYVIFYITQQGSHVGKGMLRKGVCHIGLDGLVTFEFPQVDGRFKGYIEEHLNRAVNFVSISFFNTLKSDTVDTHYKLEMEWDYTDNGRVICLNGFYSSFSLNTIYSGRIAFLRLKRESTGTESEDQITEIFKTIKIDYKTDEVIDTNTITSDTLKELNAEGYKRVKDTKYDH